MLTALLAAVGGSRVPAADFVVFAALTAVLAWRGGPAAGLGVAVFGWLFWAGFLVGRHAGVMVRCPADLAPLLVLAGVALGAVALGRYVDRPRAALARRRGPAVPAALIPAQRGTPQ